MHSSHIRNYIVIVVIGLHNENKEVESTERGGHSTLQYFKTQGTVVLKHRTL
jgi:hypothetical protein